MTPKSAGRKKKVWVGWIAKGRKASDVLACNKAIYGCFYLPKNIYFSKHEGWASSITQKIRITVEEL